MRSRRRGLSGIPCAGLPALADSHVSWIPGCPYLHPGNRLAGRHGPPYRA